MEFKLAIDTHFTSDYLISDRTNGVVGEDFRALLRQRDPSLRRAERSKLPGYAGIIAANARKHAWEVEQEARGWLIAPEVARRLCISVQTVQTFITSGSIRTMRMHGPFPKRWYNMVRIEELPRIVQELEERKRLRAQKKEAEHGSCRLSQV